MTDHELIYDWNSVEKVSSLSPKRRIQFLDETLRDGIQSPSVVDPSIDDKLRLVELANDLGIDTMDIGLPGAGKRAVDRRAEPRHQLGADPDGARHAVRVERVVLARERKRSRHRHRGWRGAGAGVDVVDLGVPDHRRHHARRIRGAFARQDRPQCPAFGG